MDAVATPSAANKEKAEVASSGDHRGRFLLAHLAKAFGVQGLAPARGDVTA